VSLILPVIFFLAALVFTFYPILPGALFAIAGMVIYGFTEGWTDFPIWFWLVQGLLVALNFLIDWLSSVLGIKRAGGSKHAMWGSAIGMFIAPFLMGPVGILVGPVVGAMAGELMHVRKAGHLARVGLGSFIGFLLGTIVKLILVAAQTVIFLLRIY
jgi:uncharacterized protein YqgC (DUF456 family)